VAFDLFQRVVLNMNINQTRKIYFIISWGIPSVFCIILAILGKFGFEPGAPWCVIHEKTAVSFENYSYELAFFHVPILIVMIFVTIFIIAILVKIIVIQSRVHKGLGTHSFKNTWLPFTFLIGYLYIFSVIVVYRFAAYYTFGEFEKSFLGYTMCKVFTAGTDCIIESSPNINSWYLIAVDSAMMGIFLFFFFGFKKENYKFLCRKKPT